MWRKRVLHKCVLLTVVVCVGVSTVFADQITFKNGDRLTGTVVKSDGKTLVLHTDAAGDVTLKFDAIQDIKTEQQLHVSLKGGKTVVGPVSTTDGKLEIATKNAGTVEATTADVTLIRNDAEQEAYEKLLHPGLMHGWTGGANVGFSLARGNSETENLALAFNAVHPTLNDKITMYASSIYTKNDLAVPPASPIVANLTQGGFRYDRNLNPRLFWFASGDYMANALQSLDLRQVYSGGFGFHAIKNARTLLDFLGGLNYTHETYSNVTTVTTNPTTITIDSYGHTNRFAALTLGDELTHKLGTSTVVTQNFYIFPNLQQTGEYRATFNLGTVTKINKRLGWQNQFSAIYVSNPPTGSKTDDVLITTGLNFSFTH